MSTIHVLRTLAFPEQEVHLANRRWSGPGHHLTVLQRSRDFWEPQGPEDWEEAERELQLSLDRLAAVLTRRWGTPRTVDLWPYLGLDNPDPNFAAPEPFNYLSNMVAGNMQVWLLPGDRWLGLTISQVDREFPFELTAVVGQGSPFTATP